MSALPAIVMPAPSKPSLPPPPPPGAPGSTGAPAAAAKPPGTVTPQRKVEEGDLPLQPEGQPTDAKKEEAPPEDQGAAAIEALFGDNPPDFLKALDAQLEQSGKKGFSVSRVALSNLPIEAQQLVANLRRLVLTKASDHAREAAGAKTERKALEDERRSLQAERAKLYSLFKDPRLAELAKAPEGEAPDPYSPEGIDHRVKHGVAERFGDFLARLKVVSEESEQQVAATMETARRTAEKEELKTALATQEGWSDPDVKDYAKRLVTAHNMHWKEAFPIAVAMVRGAEPKQSADEPNARSQTRMVRREAGAMPETPKDLDSYGLQKWYDAHPGTRARDIERYQHRLGR